MTFIPDSTINAALKSAVQKSDDFLEPYWNSIISRANNRAYGDILRRLSRRGYTLAQIASWDDGAEFNLELAIFYCLNQLRFLRPMDYGKAAQEVADRRPELDELIPIISGSAAYPDGEVGQVGIGEFDTSLDLFVPIDPNDCRIGDVTQL